MKHIIQLSGGKDSTEVFYGSIDRQRAGTLGYKIDEVVFFDTGWEFDAIYDNVKRIKMICQKEGIEFTELHPEIPFEEKMFDIVVKHRDGTFGNGYSWCGGVCRWGTTEKLKTLERHCKGHFELVGLAADEISRIQKERNGFKLFPLNEWGLVEKQALENCYRRGIEFKEDAGAGEIRLYDLLDRVSCYCCGNKNLKELRNMYLYMPKYWQRLRELQSRTSRPFRRDGNTIFDLEERFQREQEHKQLNLFKAEVKI